MAIDGTANREAVKKRRLFCRISQRHTGKFVGFIVIEGDLLKMPWLAQPNPRQDWLRIEVISTSAAHIDVGKIIYNGKVVAGRG